MKKAVIYDRASTAKQKDNWSRDDALRIGAQLAEANGFEWELRQEIKSGESLVNRPVMQSILADIEAGKIQAIICQDLIRLTRDEDSIDGLIIRQTCRSNNVPVITQTKTYDFSSDHDDMAADLEFLMGKLQKRASNNQTLRGQKEKARQGGYLGGPPPFGFKLVYEIVNENEKPKADLAIDGKWRETIEKLFEVYIEYGACSGAKELNRLGYRKPGNKLFTERDLRRIVEKPIYAGFITWGRNSQSRRLKDFEVPMVFRQELQIVPVEVWQQANETLKERGQRRLGTTAKYPFSGVLVCPFCGGVMYGRRHGIKDTRVVYGCSANSKYGVTACQGRKYSSGVVAGGIIPFLANVIKSHLGLDKALNDAANEYGKTITEAELEQRIQAELLTIREGKERIVKAIAGGLISDNEAKSQLDELRAKEQRLTQDLATIGDKERIRKDYLEAMEALRNQDVEAVLWAMYESSPNVLRKIVRLIIKSVQIGTIGRTTSTKGIVEASEFTEEFLSLEPFAPGLCTLGSIRYYVDLSQLLQVTIRPDYAII